MMIAKKFLFLSAMLVALSSFNCAATDLYKVSTSLSFKNKPFAAPTAVVKSNTPAALEASGPSGYKITFTITDIAPDKIKVATSVESQHGNLAPTVVVRLGQPASVSVGDLALTLTVDRAGS